MHRWAHSSPILTAEVTTLCFEIGTLPGLSSVLLQDRLVACKITFDLRFKKSLGAG